MRKHIGHVVHHGLTTLNDSKVFVGILMIVMNIGAKYVQVKLSDTQESYIRNYVAREIIVFCACWLGTRDIYMSIILTASFFILTEHIFNEKSPLCIVPQCYRYPSVSQTVTKEQLKDAVETVKKAAEQLK